MALDKMRAIADRHDVLTVLAEFRNIVKMTFFPDLADLSRFVMEREGGKLTAHRAASGYDVSFDSQGTIQRPPVKETPTEAFKEAERLIECFNGGKETYKITNEKEDHAGDSSHYPRGRDRISISGSRAFIHTVHASPLSKKLYQSQAAIGISGS